MPHPLDDFTPERWEAAKAVLSGDSETGVSWKAAAKAAEVSVRTLKRWVSRSAERHPEDDPLIHEIAVYCEDLVSLQAAAVEDKVWERAFQGVETPVYYQGEMVDTKFVVDNKLLMRLLEKRDPTYKTNQGGINISIDDANEIYRRLKAGTRIAEAQEEKRKLEQPTIDLVEEAEGFFQVPT